MKDSVFFTILAGVTVFVSGQFILKLILEPLVAFRRELGKLSAHLLKELNVVVHGDASHEVTDELRKLTSSVLSASYAVPLYPFFAFILCLPSKNNLLKGARSLNVIIADLYSQQSAQKETTTKRFQRLKDLEKNLKIKVTYGFDQSTL